MLQLSTLLNRQMPHRNSRKREIDIFSLWNIS